MPFASYLFRSLSFLPALALLALPSSGERAASRQAGCTASSVGRPGVIVIRQQSELQKGFMLAVATGPAKPEADGRVYTALTLSVPGAGVTCRGPDPVHFELDLGEATAGTGRLFVTSSGWVEFELLGLDGSRKPLASLHAPGEASAILTLPQAVHSRGR